jgi:hypothetical protein
LVFGTGSITGVPSMNSSAVSVERTTIGGGPLLKPAGDCAGSAFSATYARNRSSRTSSDLRVAASITAAVYSAGTALANVTSVTWGDRIVTMRLSMSTTVSPATVAVP